jgi:micrococcal nuclease
VQTLTAAPTQGPVPTSTPEPTDIEIPTDTLTSATDTPETVQIAGSECIPSEAERTEAQVTRVIDGDTIEVDIGGQSFKVSYIGMDTPESTSEIEYFGPEATAFKVQMVEGKTVTLIKDASETDQFDRLLRYVIVGDFFVNYELVRQGFANTTTFPPDVACESVYLEAERLAREGGGPGVIGSNADTGSKFDAAANKYTSSTANADIWASRSANFTAAKGLRSVLSRRLHPLTSAGSRLWGYPL